MQIDTIIEEFHKLQQNQSINEEDWLRSTLKAFLEEKAREIESRKFKLPHIECAEGKKEMCDACNDYTVYNQALFDAAAILRK